MNIDDYELRKKLTTLAYEVTQNKGTERAFTSDFHEQWETGDYHCIVCAELLFSSENQFNSGCGWPSFDKPITQSAIIEHQDLSLPQERVEVVCRHCNAHLGHVFTDGPSKTTGLRYCINGVALSFSSNK